MKNYSIGFLILCVLAILTFAQCATQGNEPNTTPSETASFGGFDSQIKWGEHLVTICGCHDCHTPKKMTAHGPQLDSTSLLSGHPAQMPPPDIDRKEIESKFLALTNPMLTAWVGPWGVSYSANLTPDETGTGTWQESNFITAIREGKFKGISSGRTLLPPMPWEMYRNMTDGELQAIFAYLKSIPPVKNAVPEPLPPVMAAAH